MPEIFQPGVVQPPDDFAARFSRAIDALLRGTGVPQVLGRVGGAVGRGIGSLVASPENIPAWETAFQQAGEGLPRLGLDVAASRIPGPVGKLLGPADVGLQTYAQTGKVAPALASAGAFALAPRTGAIGENVASRAVPTLGNTAQKLVEAGGRIAGTVAPFEAAHMVTDYSLDQPYRPLSPENIAGTVAGVLPFEVGRIPNLVRPSVPSIARTRAIASTTPVPPRVPQVSTSVVSEEVPSYRVTWSNAGTPVVQDFGDERTAKDYADLLRQKGASEQDPVVQAMGSTMRQRVVHNMAFLPSQLQSGFGLRGVDLLNEPAKALKLAPDKEGLLDSKNLLGRLKNTLSPVEYDIYEKAGLGDFLSQNPKVDAKSVQDWMLQNGPKVEVKTFGEGAADPRLGQIRHELDGLVGQYNVAHILEQPIGNVGNFLDSLQQHGELNPSHRQKVDQLYSQYKSLEQISSAGNVDVYPGVAPSNLPIKLVMVRVPLPRNDRGVTTSREALHVGGHFGLADSNVLGWSRVQYEDYQGKRVAHVIEAQSDWGQAERERKQFIQEHGEHNEYIAPKATSHPLLKDYNRLILKATIDQAIKDGATHIAISDAETAMMSEGHDLYAQEQVIKEIPTNYSARDRLQVRPKQLRELMQQYPAPRYRVVGDAAGEKIRIYDTSLPKIVSQEPGMRLNYDRILPDIARELTGEKGERVSFGEHMMPERVGSTHIGSPVFKNEQGSPKTDRTALMFPLDKVKKRLDEQGGFNLIGKDLVRDMQYTLGNDATPERVSEALQRVRDLQPQKGENLTQTIARQVGLDPRLFRDMLGGRQAALTRAYDYFTRVFHTWGETPQRAEMFARQAMVGVSRLAKYLGKTEFAMHPAEEGKFSQYNVKDAGSENMRYLIAGLDIPNTPEGKARQSREAQVFEFIRGIAHEGVHNMIEEISTPIGKATPEQKRAVLEALVSSQLMTPNERIATMENMFRFVVPPAKMAEISRANYATYEKNPMEFLTDFGSILAIGGANKRTNSTFRDILYFGSKDTQAFAHAIYRDVSMVWNAVRDFFKQFFGGFSGDKRAKEVHELVDSIHKNLSSLMEEHDKAQQMLDTFFAHSERRVSNPLDPPPVVTTKQMMSLFRRLEAVDQGKVPLSVAWKEENSIYDTAKALFFPNEADKADVRLGTFKDFWKPMVQLVAELREKGIRSAEAVLSLGFSYQNDVSIAAHNAWKLHWVNDAGKVDWKRLRWIGKEGSAQNKAFNELALLENMRSQKGDSTELLSPAERVEKSAAYKGLSQEDRQKVDTSLEQSASMMRDMARHQWFAHRARVVHALATIIQSYDKTMYNDKAEQFAKQLVDLHFDESSPLQYPDPSMRQQADAQRIQALEAAVGALPMPDTGKANIRNALEENKKAWQMLGDRILGPVGQDGLRDGKTFYLPEVRFHDWHLAWKEIGEYEPHLEHFRTEAERDRKYQQVQGIATLDWVKRYNKKDRAERFRGLVREELLGAYADADKALFDSVLSGIASDNPDRQEIVDQVKAEFQPGAGTTDVSVSPYMKEREFIPGREALNMVEGMTRYVDSIAYHVAKRHVKQASTLVLRNPDMRANPNIRNNFEKYLRYVTDAEGREWSFMKNLIFFRFMGLNPSTMGVELSQPLLSLVPVLVRGTNEIRGMGIRETYNKMRQTYQDIGYAYAHGKQYKDSEVNKAVAEAKLKRDIDEGFISDLYGESDFDFVKARSMVTGNDKVADSIDMMARPLYQMVKFARHVYGGVTAFNGQVAFVTAFKQARESGLSYDRAYQYAAMVNRTSMYGGGKANRPLALQRMGAMSGIGGVMYSLQSYTLNTIALMARLSKEAITRSPLTMAERTSATKAAALMWGTQLAFAGAMGLPLVAAGVALLEQIFPGVEIKKNLRQALVGLFGDDTDMGHHFADAASNGLFNLGPFDVGARFSLGNMMGVSTLEGFSWKNLMGPAASQLEDAAKVVQEGSQGHWSEAAMKLPFVPMSIQNMMRLYHDEGAVRDRMGRLVGELSPLEQGMTALGFKSKRYKQYYEEQAIRQRSEDISANNMRDLRKDIANSLRVGDTEGARAKLIQGLKDVGPYDPHDMLREAVELVSQQNNPQQARAGSAANAANATAIGRMYPQPPVGSELQRVLSEHMMAVRTAGPLAGRLSKSEVRQAVLVDRYLQEHPSATLVEARNSIQKLTRSVLRRKGMLDMLSASQEGR